MIGGWKSDRIGMLSCLITSGSRGWSEFYSDDGNPFIRMTNLPREGIRLDLSDLRFVKLPGGSSEGQRTQIRKGDILISITAELGKIGFVDFDLDRTAYVNQHVCLVRLKSGSVDPEFMAAYLAAAPQRKLFNSLNDAGAKSGLNLTTIENFAVRFPPLPEQRKIAEILRTWDEAIEKLEALRAAKLRRLEALRDALLFEGLRVGEVRRNRPMRRIGEVTRELTTRNGDGALGRDLVMGVTNSRGIVPMREQTVADDIGRYKKLPPLAFAYNPMRINVGSIAMNAGNQTVLVSPDYVVFACDEEGMEPDYLDHLRQTRWWLHHINSGGSGSVRQRTYYDDLAALHLPLPDLGEQRAIVKVLNTAKADVTASVKLGEALTSQKRGLMQKLLTGEWPVNV